MTRRAIVDDLNLRGFYIYSKPQLGNPSDTTGSQDWQDKSEQLQARRWRKINQQSS